jgi:hypothetical protein
MRTNELKRSKSGKVFLSIGSTAILATIAAGLLHLPWARPWLRRMGGCPVPRISPAQIEAAQGRAFRVLRGTALAPSRPALGFALQQTTLAEVQGWARKNGLSCEVRRDGALLICPTVPAASVSSRGPFTYDELAFGFRLRDLRLVNLTTLRTGLAREAAGADFRSLSRDLAGTLGEPAARSAGENAYVAYRFADYLAEVSAMPLPRRGYALREHYLSALE